MILWSLNSWPLALSLSFVIRAVVFLAVSLFLKGNRNNGRSRISSGNWSFRVHSTQFSAAHDLLFLFEMFKFFFNGSQPVVVSFHPYQIMHRVKWDSLRLFKCWWRKQECLTNKIDLFFSVLDIQHSLLNLLYLAVVFVRYHYCQVSPAIFVLPQTLLERERSGGNRGIYSEAVVLFLLVSFLLLSFNLA